MSGKPNILMFRVDTVSIGDFGCYGGANPLGAKTPNIDRFAGESLMLTNDNVEAQCTPSRSALMTGRHPVRTGCITALPGSGLVACEVTSEQRFTKEAWKHPGLELPEETRAGVYSVLGFFIGEPVPDAFDVAAGPGVPVAAAATGPA